MARERLWTGLFAVATVAVIVLVVFQVGLVTPPWSDDAGDVRIVDGETGEPLADVEVEVADTPAQRYTGLSDHEELDPGEGMLFVHGDEADRTYVMRGMDFGIDIVFVDADGEITTIHRAPEPGSGEDGSEREYDGRAKWVLEVPYGYTDENGVEPGDEVEIDLESG